jgi:hypothetical protein
MGLGSSMKKKVFDDKVIDAESKEVLGASEFKSNAVADANAGGRRKYLEKKRLALIG